MSMSFHFHCVYSIEKRAFVLSISDNAKPGRHVFTILPDQFKTTLEDAERQSASQNWFGDLKLNFGPNGGGFVFNGFDIKAAVEYLRKVYDGWHRFTFANDGQNKGSTKL